MTEPGQNPKSPSSTRIVFWLIGGGVGVYLLGSGIIGIMNGGS